MKKLLLILLLTLNNINCNPIDSKSELLSFNTVFERVTQGHNVIGTVVYWFYPGIVICKALEHVTQNVPLEEIKPTLIAWHKEKSNIFNGTVNITYIHPPFFNGAADAELVQKAEAGYEQLRKIMPNASCLDYYIIYSHYSENAPNLEIIKVLKEVNALRKLSDNEVDLIGQLLKTGKTSTPNEVRKRIILIEQLIAIYSK